VIGPQCGPIPPSLGGSSPNYPSLRRTLSQWQTGSPAQHRQVSHGGRRPLRGGPGARQTGGADPRKDQHGSIDFRIQRQIKAYAETDDPPVRVKAMPVIIIVYILQLAYDTERRVADTTIAGMICITFFFLLHPGEYTGTTSDDTPFRLEDVSAYVRDRQMDVLLCSEAELDATTLGSYTFTTHKNRTQEENIVKGRSGNALCCPVRATVRRIKHHRPKKSSPTAPVGSTT
jgi:hypothetical protein